MPVPKITPLPDAPSRADSANFDTRADAFMTALPPMVGQANAAIDGINSAVTTAENARGTAIAASDVATAARDTAIAASDVATAARDTAIAASDVTTAARGVAVAAKDSATASQVAAATSAQQAAASAASASAVSGLPAFTTGDEGKAIVVNGSASGYLLSGYKTVNGAQILGGGNLTTDRAVPLAEGAVTNGVCDFATGYVFSMTISGSTTISLANAPVSGAALIILRLTNGGSATVTWPSGIKWPGGTAPKLTASGLDEVVLMRTNAGVWSGAVRKDVK